MKKTNSNRLRRREPYHYDATGAQYIACIETALQKCPQWTPEPKQPGGAIE